MKIILKKTPRLTTIVPLLLMAAILVIVSCNKQETSPIKGKWKLIRISIAKDNQLPEIIDYSENNIIYEFQENNILVVAGYINDLFIFDNFQEGEHFYEYIKPYVCPTCLPGKNLSIDKPKSGQSDGCYNCIIDVDNKTMKISNNEVIGGVIDETGLRTGGNSYVWEKKFIKLN